MTYLTLPIFVNKLPPLWIINYVKIIFKDIEIQKLLLTKKQQKGRAVLYVIDGMEFLIIKTLYYFIAKYWSGGCNRFVHALLKKLTMNNNINISIYEWYLYQI